MTEYHGRAIAPILVAVLPPRDLLAKKLHEAIRQAQARMLPELPPAPQTA
jgi:hypothetical protein